MTLTRSTIFLAVALSLSVTACSDDGGEPGVDGPPAFCFDEDTHFRMAEFGNIFDTDPQLGDPLSLTAPNFAPAAVIDGATPPAPFDDTASYIGAIGADDWTANWTAYPTNTSGPDQGTVTMIPEGDITDAQTWTTGNTYVLQGTVFVTAGGSVTIEPGVLVRGQSGSSLVVSADGTIDAQGTSDMPIVFTSTVDDGAMPGNWGGIVLLGRAPINVVGGVNNVEGFAGQEDKTEYGGEDAAYNCGTLRYIRIEYAGFELSLDNELNGLTVAGCGSDTVIDYIQVHLAEDDGVEFFGGTAGLRHVVITQADDDSLDWDQGWSGNVQWLIVQQSTTRGDNGFESDNNGNNNDATPRSTPTLWNVTLVGGGGPVEDDQGAMTLRRGTGGNIHNAIITRFSAFSADVRDWATVQQAQSGVLSIETSYFYDNASGAGWPDGFDIANGMENDCEPR